MALGVNDGVSTIEHSCTKDMVGPDVSQAIEGQLSIRQVRRDVSAIPN